jgi:hypothetical protein
MHVFLYSRNSTNDGMNVRMYERERKRICILFHGLSALERQNKSTRGREGGREKKKTCVRKHTSL